MFAYIRKKINLSSFSDVHIFAKMPYECQTPPFRNFYLKNQVSYSMPKNQSIQSDSLII